MKVILPALMLTASIGSAQAGVRFAERGRARCVIVSQAGASPSEKHAARELASVLKQITGADFEIRTDVQSTESAVIVGPGATAGRFFPDVKMAQFGGEELVIQTKGKLLLLAGGRPRGTLYAVYRFLQTRCGVRWWTPWASRIPRNPSLTIPDLNVREAPAFESRAPHWTIAFDGDWAARNFVNSHFSRLDEGRGGKIVYEGFVHTFYSLVPPDKYFATHPEWFSLVKGKRVSEFKDKRDGENGQLCTTNPDLREHIVRTVREWLRANPQARIVSVSQNDWYGACECPNCKALDEAEGSHAGTMLALVNYVAERVESEFPHVAVDTLAYQYTRKAPKTLRPRPNVIVRLCSIECNFAKPLEDPAPPEKTPKKHENPAFADDIRAWSKISNRLYVWDYTTNFIHYVLPHPNYYTLGPNVRFFHRHGVRGLFEQGAYQGHGGEMEELKSWVISQLLWNPLQDDRKLIREFVEGYYGKSASKPILEYLHFMDSAADPYHLGCHQRTHPFLNIANLTRAEQLWNKAESAAKDNQTLLWRVRQGRLPVWYAWLQRWNELRKEHSISGEAWPVPGSRKLLAEKWLAGVTGPGPKGWSPVTHVNEPGQTPQQFVAQLGPDPP